MSFLLKKDGIEVTKSGWWDVVLFSRTLNTSFPKEVTQDFVWEQDGYWLGWVPDPEPVYPTPDEIAAQKEAEKEQLRAQAYRNESDPLFFKFQRGEVDKQVWLDKVQEIKDRYQ